MEFQVYSEFGGYKVADKYAADKWLDGLTEAHEHTEEKCASQVHLYELAQHGIPLTQGFEDLTSAFSLRRCLEWKVPVSCQARRSEAESPLKWQVAMRQCRAGEDRFDVGSADGWTWFAVFDGHNAPYKGDTYHVVDVCQQKLCRFVVSKLKETADVEDMIRMAFMEFDKQLHDAHIEQDDKIDTGTTFSGVFLRDNQFWCVQLGDSMIHVFQPQKRKTVLAYSAPLHTPKAETTRISQAGWQVYGTRIDGVMAVSRAFGDFDYKRRKTETDELDESGCPKETFGPYEPHDGAMTCLPDIWRGEWKKGTKIWLATDGVVEKVLVPTYVDMIQESEPTQIIEHFLRRTTDDVTLMKIY